MSIKFGIIFLVLTEVVGAIDEETSCGKLKVEKNNLTETERANFTFTLQPGRAIIWEKQIKSSFRRINSAWRYDIVNNKAKTVHALLIYLTKYADSGTYRVNCSDSVSNTVQLHIVPTPPTSPEFLGVEDIHDCRMCIPAALNVTVRVTCSVDGGSLPIELIMFKDGHIINDVQRFSNYKASFLKTFVRHNFTPTSANFDTVFKCTVKNPALKVELAQSAKLYIKADPATLAIKVKSATENETSEIQCITTQGSPPIKSSMYFESSKQTNVQITDEIKTGQTYSVTTSLAKVLTRFDNQKVVICCSNILELKCSTAAHVNVKFPPRTINMVAVKKDNNENGDTVLILECSVADSNPKSSVDWNGVKSIPKTLLDEEYKNHTETHGWTFSTTWKFYLTKKDNYRRIKCTVTNPDFPDLVLQESYRPNITYAPVITISGSRHQTAYVGEDVFLTCHVDSNPPSVIVWYNEMEQIGESSGANNLELHLTNVSRDHSQTYTCTASNNIGGRKKRNITLIVKDSIETPYNQPSGVSEIAPIAGPIVGGVVVINVAGVAVTVFLTLRKRRQNAAPQRKRTLQNKVEERKPGVHQTKSAEDIKLQSEHGDGPGALSEYAEVAENELVQKMSEDTAIVKPESHYYNEIMVRGTEPEGQCYYNDRLGQGAEQEGQCYYNDRLAQVTITYEQLGESKKETETYTQINPH